MANPRVPRAETAKGETTSARERIVESCILGADLIESEPQVTEKTVKWKQNSGYKTQSFSFSR